MSDVEPQTAAAAQAEPEPIEQLSINTIRTLCIDAVQAANSGHPGAPMALAPVAYLLARQLRVNPKNPHWFDRDRFVLSAGHASMLQYAMLHLTGFDLSLEQIRHFRQWDSQTPGHPEFGHTAGVETTTGPLGQGCMTAVGMAMAEAHLAAVYNRPGHEIVDHRTYVICSDGDLMEGASHEAASVAGHLRLGKLIFIYDDNRITIDGSTDLTYSDDVPARFRAYGWHVQDLGDHANDLPALAEALENARAEADRPSLVIVRSHIGFGSPNKVDTSSAHGSPLGEQEVALTKEAYGWPVDEFFRIPDPVRNHMGEAVDRGRKAEAAWNEALESYREHYPDLAAQLESSIAGDLPADWDIGVPEFSPEDGAIATRSASGKVLNAIASRIPWLMGGSADLAGSNNSLLDSTENFGPDSYAGRNIHFGIREHFMAASCSGMALHGGIRPYAATFFVFTDYARPAIRLAALMGQPVIYIMTHDSIGLGEDGPTHQPVEHLAALRAMPGLHVVRPADANETAAAWKYAIRRTEGPTMLVLTRQKVPTLQPTEALSHGVSRGAYVAADSGSDSPDVLIMATGSEVSVALEARTLLAAQGIEARVISMPCWEQFRTQPAEYRDKVLPPAVRARVAIEAGCTAGWHEWIGERGDVLGIDRFGASAPAPELYRQFGLTAENVAARALAVLEKRE
ncbi:MAG: transketolase [Gemmatimonadota bacterium]